MSHLATGKSNNQSCILKLGKLLSLNRDGHITLNIKPPLSLINPLHHVSDITLWFTPGLPAAPTYNMFAAMKKNLIEAYTGVGTIKCPYFFKCPYFSLRMCFMVHFCISFQIIAQLGLPGGFLGIIAKICENILVWNLDNLKNGTIKCSRKMYLTAKQK